MSGPTPFEDCPAPAPPQRILLGHGGGGSLTRSLYERVFAPAFANPLLDARHDGAVFDLPAGRAALTTDAYVVRPLEFPGGDLGRMAICGTANDLAMCGARPLHLSASFVLEEGLEIAVLERLVASMAGAAREAGVEIVTGDTKVVERGSGDGVFITTSGVGVVEHTLPIGPGAARPGDAVLLSGDVGRHGAAIMASREALGLDTDLRTDCALLWPAVDALLAADLPVACLRDLTRGGLATALVEIARDAGVALAVDERQIAVSNPVRGLCELIGLDPLYVANEGRFLCIVPEARAEDALRALRACPVSANAVRIGHVTASPAGRVTLKSAIGSERVLHLQTGEQLPRIC
ncbi:MAG: hydrogenase expression/formation protein HypE [Myxococcota bacterium]|nr:hydrogenase expression/formation protein HypE [Myxococcota bacterium]